MAARLRKLLERDYGLRVYRSENFSEIRVLFIECISEIEEYKCDGESEIPVELINSIRQENPGHQIFDGNRSVKVCSALGYATEGFSHELADRDQREHTYSGQVTVRKDRDWHRAILRDHDTVVEVAIFPHYAQDFRLIDGASYSVTVLDQDSEDINTRLAVISRREHTDWHDAVDDAGVRGIQQLARITSGDKVLFDHSVCSFHHVKMELLNVPVEGGFHPPGSDAEAYCMQHYPYFRNFASGGCMDLAESTRIYVCPKCVAECNDYARQHPKQDKAK